MKKTSLTLISLFLFVFSAVSQIKGTTNEGRKVLLFEDGTWKYAEENITPMSLEDLSCESLCVKLVDEMEGISYYSTKKAVIISQDGESGITSEIVKVLGKEVIIWNLRAIGSGCIDKNAKVIILFTDDYKIEFIANNTFNCDGNATTYFLGGWGKTEYLKALKTKRIKAIRVSADKGFVQESVDENQAETIRLSFECVSNYK